MSITRSVRGLDTGFYDDFSSDTSANYDVWENRDFTIAAGVATTENAAVDQYAVRKSITGVRCVTLKANSPRSYTRYGGPALFANGQLDAAGDLDGYVAYGTNPTTMRLYKVTDGGVSALGSSVVEALAENEWYYYRLFRDDTDVYAKWGTATLGDDGHSAPDGTYTSGLYGGISSAYYHNNYDWLDGRTSHLIVCTGMTNGHYLRVSDGTTTAEAVASGGSASVDASAVLFPLATLQIRTASGGGGDLIDSLGTGDYADMGGGDTYEYSADAVGYPTYYYAQQ